VMDGAARLLAIPGEPATHVRSPLVARAGLDITPASTPIAPPSLARHAGSSYVGGRAMVEGPAAAALPGSTSKPGAKGTSPASRFAAGRSVQ
jgi:hypothetical protein